MISKTAQNKIKKELKRSDKGYAETVLSYLKEHGIFNAKGDEFSESMIYMMLTKPITHPRLERAIIDCYEHHKKLNKEEDKRRKFILQTA